MGLRFGFCLAETTLTFLVSFYYYCFSALTTHLMTSHDQHIISIPIPIPSSLYNFVLALDLTGSYYLHSPLNFLCSFISFLLGPLRPTKLSLHTMFYFFMYFRQPLGPIYFHRHFPSEGFWLNIG